MKHEKVKNETPLLYLLRRAHDVMSSVGYMQLMNYQTLHLKLNM